MNSKRLRLGLFGLIGICGVLFVLVFINGLSKLTTKSQQLVDLKLQSKTADAQLASLAQAKKEVAKYSYFKDIAKTVVPADKDQAQAVLDILQIASASGVTIQDITFPTSSLGVKSSESALAQSSSTTKTVVSQAKPVSGISGLYSIELTVTHNVNVDAPVNQQTTYPELHDFLNRIEHDRRTAQITNLNIEPLLKDNKPTPYISFSLTTNIFMKP